MFFVFVVIFFHLSSENVWILSPFSCCYILEETIFSSFGTSAYFYLSLSLFEVDNRNVAKAMW